MFSGPVGFDTAAKLTAQAPAMYEWDTFVEKNKVSGWVGVVFSFAARCGRGSGNYMHEYNTSFCSSTRLSRRPHARLFFYRSVCSTDQIRLSPFVLVVCALLLVMSWYFCTFFERIELSKLLFSPPSVRPMMSTKQSHELALPPYPWRRATNWRSVCVVAGAEDGGFIRELEGCWCASSLHACCATLSYS